MRKVGWGRLQIFSESFLALLSDEERSALNVRPVQRAKPGMKRYLEILGPSIARTVGVRGLPGLLRRKCKTCGTCCLTYLIGSEMFTFLALGDLPSPLPSVFVIEDENHWLDLCMTRQRFSELRLWQRHGGCNRPKSHVAPDREVIRATTTRRTTPRIALPTVRETPSHTNLDWCPPWLRGVRHFPATNLPLPLS